MRRNRGPEINHSVKVIFVGLIFLRNTAPCERKFSCPRRSHARISSCRSRQAGHAVGDSHARSPAAAEVLLRIGGLRPELRRPAHANRAPIRRPEGPLQPWAWKSPEPSRRWAPKRRPSPRHARCGIRRPWRAAEFGVFPAGTLRALARRDARRKAAASPWPTGTSPRRLDHRAKLNRASRCVLGAAAGGLTAVEIGKLLARA